MYFTDRGIEELVEPPGRRAGHPRVARRAPARLHRPQPRVRDPDRAPRHLARPPRRRRRLDPAADRAFATTRAPRAPLRISRDPLSAYGHVARDRDVLRADRCEPAGEAGGGSARRGGVARNVYVTSLELAAGKSAIALGVAEVLSRRVRRLGVFRPFVRVNPIRWWSCCAALRMRRGRAELPARGAAARRRAAGRADRRDARSATTRWSATATPSSSSAPTTGTTWPGTTSRRCPTS